MCLFPWKASLPQEGGRPFPTPEGELALPCGKCMECLTLRAFHWGTRARHEISEHSDNCFLTLSYNDENLKSEILDKKPFQDFLKRLREKTGKKLKYMASHEYGENYKRPHHHAIIFGYNPPDQKFLRKTKSGHSLFTSEELEELWGLGYHSIGTANEKTAYYIASYALKAKEHIINGEVVKDSFNVSTRPGIGLSYLEKNYKQLIASGDPLPRYYQKKLYDIDPIALQEYENKQLEKAKEKSSYKKLAKYKIGMAKNSHQSHEYRSAPDRKRDRYYEKQLQHQAESEAHLCKQEKHK